MLNRNPLNPRNQQAANFADTAIRRKGRLEFATDSYRHIRGFSVVLVLGTTGLHPWLKHAVPPGLKRRLVTRRVSEDLHDALAYASGYQNTQLQKLIQPTTTNNRN